MSRAAVHFERELELLIERFRHEYEMTYVEAVGVLESIKVGLLIEHKLGDDGSHEQ